MDVKNTIILVTITNEGNNTYGRCRLKAVLIFEMITQGCDVKVFKAVWA
jgi:hypothetical protein